MCDYGRLIRAELQLTLAVALWNVEFYPYGQSDDDAVFAVVGDINVSKLTGMN